MSKNNLIVLKIGGSVITDKKGQLEPRTETISRIVEEIFDSEARDLILVHGGGSFGHPTAAQYGIKEGFKNDTQKVGFAETHHFMTVLNGLFMDALVWHHVPSISITPSSCIITKEGRIDKFFDEQLSALMRIGFVAVMYGDAVLDSKLGFTILSGDQLAATLAVRFNARQIILGVDVDGLFDADPKEEKNTKLYERLSLKDAKNILDTLEPPVKPDVTGGMPSKIREMLPAVEKGIPVSIMNATVPKNVLNALIGESVKGTRIMRE